jgi:hypothetical protein
VAVLRDRGIPFAVVGAAAMAVHGVARSTLDLDLLTPDSRSLARTTWASLEGGEATVDIRIGGVDDPLIGVVRFTAADTTIVDLIVGRGPWQADVVARARQYTLDGVVVPVATASDLIALKLYAGGPQDAWDIEQLLQAGHRVRLVAAVETLLPSLPEDARRLWARIVEPR